MMRARHEGFDGARASPFTLPLAPIWIGVATLLVVAIVFGGGTYQQSWPDAVVQLASLPVLWLALAKIPERWSEPAIRPALILCAVIVAIPLLQLIPLPPGLWSRLPGRDFVARGVAESGVPLPWFPLSLGPSETLRSILSLIPPVAVFLATLSLDANGRRGLSLVLIAAGFLSVVIGLAQVAQGSGSVIQPYGEGSVGFFLNRNHYAAFLYALIPFAAAWVVGLAFDRRRGMVVGIMLAVMVFASLLLGLGIARSRAGIVLAIIATLLSLLLARTGTATPLRARSQKWVFAAGAIGALLIFQFGLVGILQRLESDPLADDRWEIAGTTLRASKDFFPVGSGLGTFDSIYDKYETIDMLVPTYVNNAHDDFLELLLEAGLAAIIVVAWFLVWFVVRLFRIWRSPARHANTLDLSLSRAGSLAVILLFLHSFVDYPLRSAALSCLFAFSCALLLLPQSNLGPDITQRRRPRAQG